MSGDVIAHSDGLFLYIENGDITYVIGYSTAHVESELATTQIFSNGSFTFQIDNLAPGKYFIVAQDVLHAALPENWILSNVLALARESGNPESVMVVEIPEDIALPFIVDTGEVNIILP